MLDRQAGQLVYHHHARGEERIPAPDAVLALPLRPEKSYELGFQWKKLDRGVCTRLVLVGETDPTRTREVLDPINGPTTVPATRVLWSLDR